MPSRPGPGDGGTCRFSTLDFPERDRLEAWCEIVGRAVLNLEIAPLPGMRCHGDITVHALPGLRIGTGDVAGMQFRRSAAMLDSDDLVLHVSRRGGFQVRQSGREIVLERGAALAVTSAEPLWCAAPVPERFLLFRVPRTLLAPMVATLDAKFMRPIAPDGAALRLLVTYADAVCTVPQFAAPQARNLAAAHIRDLIAVTLGAVRDGVERADAGRRAARLRAIKADVAAALAQPDLSVAAVARRQGVTARYVQMLFEREGSTFSEFVLAARLARAHRMLANARLAARSITSVAFDAGFQDVSYFNRTFRRRFGCTPSDVRASACAI